MSHDPVGETSQKRICSNAGESVRATAFQADLKLAYRDVFTLVGSCRCSYLTYKSKSIFHLVSLDLLRLHELHSCLIHLADKLTESGKLVVLTSQGNHKHSCSIRMMHHVRKNPTGVFMVTSKLRTAVVMREGDDFLYGRILSEFLFKLFLNALSHSVHATYSRDDPEFVPDAGSSVCTTIAFEKSLV